MAEQSVSFTSQGMKLAANIHTPAGMKKGERRPAFIVLHGFGGNKDAGNVLKPAKWFLDQGYIVMRFDFRGCGQSEGQRGNIICLDQVQNTRDAVTLLQRRPDVDPGKIAPNTRMPDFFAEDDLTKKRKTQYPEILNGDIEAQIQAIRDHLFTLGGGRVVVR